MCVFLLRNVPETDVQSLALTCKVARDVVHRFELKAYSLASLASLLRHFLTSTEFHTFHRFMKDVGVVISGSTSLQFLDRISYPDSDLDTYTPLAGATEYLCFLVHIGYQFELDQHNGVDPFQLLDNIKGARTWLGTDPYISRRAPGYLIAGISLVLTLKRAGRTIQVMVTKTPIEAILGFHSSACLVTLSNYIF